MQARIVETDPGAFAIQVETEVGGSDLVKLIRRHRPTVLHFAGHGSRDGLYLQGPDGKGQLLSPEALASAVDTVGSVRLAVLNACYSDATAKALLNAVPVVVGMDDRIPDTLARQFAAEFYGAMADTDGTVSHAYRVGKASIQAQAAEHGATPILVERGEGKARALYLRAPKPELRAYLSLDGRGRLVAYDDYDKLIPKLDSVSYDDNAYFEIWIYVAAPQSDATEVVYELDESYEDSDEGIFRSEKARRADFKHRIYTEGDFVMRATIWRANGTGIGLSSLISRAIYRHYLPDVAVQGHSIMRALLAVQHPNIAKAVDRLLAHG